MDCLATPRQPLFRPYAANAPIIRPNPMMPVTTLAGMRDRPNTLASLIDKRRELAGKTSYHQNEL